MTKRTPQVPGATAETAVKDDDGQADKAKDAASHAASEPATPAPVGSRPHPSTIDPHKITAPVLTSQGWICPAESGRVDNTRK